MTIDLGTGDGRLPQALAARDADRLFVGIDANAASPLGRPDTPALLEMWARWDGEWYLDIATRGYAAPLPSGQFDMRPNFFPAFPAAMTLLTVVVRHPALAAILISNSAAVSLSVLHAAIVSDPLLNTRS